jgi:hypothetical protein
MAEGYTRALSRSHAKGELPGFEQRELEVIIFTMLAARNYLSYRYLFRDGRTRRLPAWVDRAYMKLMTGGMMYGGTTDRPRRTRRSPNPPDHATRRQWHHQRRRSISRRAGRPGRGPHRTRGDGRVPRCGWRDTPRHPAQVDRGCGNRRGIRHLRCAAMPAEPDNGLSEPRGQRRTRSRGAGARQWEFGSCERKGPCHQR